MLSSSSGVNYFCYKWIQMSGCCDVITIKLYSDLYDCAFGICKHCGMQTSVIMLLLNPLCSNYLLNHVLNFRSGNMVQMYKNLYSQSLRDTGKNTVSAVVSHLVDVLSTANSVLSQQQQVTRWHWYFIKDICIYNVNISFIYVS
jgi:hypothetical protein